MGGRAEARAWPADSPMVRCGGPHGGEGHPGGRRMTCRPPAPQTHTHAMPHAMLIPHLQTAWRGRGPMGAYVYIHYRVPVYTVRLDTEGIGNGFRTDTTSASLFHRSSSLATNTPSPPIYKGLRRD